MARRSRRRRPVERSKRTGAAKVEGRGYVAVRHPFSDLDPNLVRAKLLENARLQAAAFQGRLDRLLALLKRVSPTGVIANLSGLGLQVSMGSDGAASPLMKDIDQHHVELLQALMLTLPETEWGKEPPPAWAIQAAIDDIKALATGFQQQRFVAVEDAEGLQERTVLALSEKMRMHTQMVRNWGYYSDVGVIARELYGPLDEAIRAHHGFSASELLDTAAAMVSLLERRISERWGRLRKAMRGRTPQRVIRGFYAQFPDAPGDAEALIATMPPGCTREQAAGLMLTVYGQGLWSTMAIEAADLAETAGLDEALVGRVMDALALSPAALEGQSPERFFMDNPIWSAPLVRFDDAYFCPLPQAIFSKIHEIMRRLCELAGIQKALQARRANYLEDKTEKLLRQALPGADVRANVTWRDGNARYETDLVARLDRTLIIVEAKSAALTPQGLRGAPDRVRRHIRELVVAPSEQSARLEGLVRRAAKGDADARTGLSDLRDLAIDLDEVVRISVTLDDISILSSSEGELKEAGWVPAELDLGCTLNIADFGCVIDILGRPARIVHYFAERQRAQKASRLMADEMHYLGLYLRTGFNIAGLEGDEKRLIITGMSKDIDAYYTARDAGITTRKPTVLAQPYFEKLLATLESRRPKGWLSISCDIMRAFDLLEQRQTETWMNRLKRTVEKSWRDPDHECSVLVTPPPIRDTAILIHIYPPQLAEVRRDRLATVAARAFEETGRRRCVVISRDTSRWSQPYSFAGVAIAGEELDPDPALARQEDAPAVIVA